MFKLFYNNIFKCGKLKSTNLNIFNDFESPTSMLNNHVILTVN